MKVLFLLVAYNNHEEVEAFLDHIAKLDGSDEFAAAICDNSPETCWTPSSPLVTAIVRRPENPGYLEGALQALAGFRSAGYTLPPWVFLSNTDISFVSNDLCAVLERSFPPDRAIVIAPWITQGERLDMNPHLAVPRDRKRLAINRGLTYTTSLSYGYLIMSGLLKRRRSVKQARLGARATFTSDEIYAPYGALVGFTRAFIYLDCIPHDVPLYAEEGAIAAAARQHGAPVRRERDIHVQHAAHGATGRAVSWQRAAKLKVAFRYLWEASSG